MTGKERIKRRRGVYCANLYLLDMPDPKYVRNKDERRQASYARSTMLYLRKLFEEDPSRTPRQITLLFIDSVSKKRGVRYSIAYDTAVDFFDKFYML